MHFSWRPASPSFVFSTGTRTWMRTVHCKLKSSWKVTGGGFNATPNLLAIDNYEAQVQMHNRSLIERNTKLSTSQGNKEKQRTSRDEVKVEIKQKSLRLKFCKIKGIRIKRGYPEWIRRWQKKEEATAGKIVQDMASAFSPDNVSERVKLEVQAKYKSQ
ncbi:hypothetical protein BJ508DRAFT_372367 [Ascobolus immersus RN42]|uniref:Uncharacterized protein n=1 Tax=Ascobolus immersus RN42 TaxID=1160509 RepID=A0A3N4INJ7_ASCIM|nr:hypothetical protein BJ508DRAFT_372367 [Ascobolus immersus RN42]